MKKTLLTVIILLIMILSISTVAFAAESVDVVLLSDDSSPFWLIFLLAGPIFYFTINAKYAGKGLRHNHEQKTESQVENMQGFDKYLESVTRSSKSTIGQPLYSNQTYFAGMAAKLDLNSRIGLQSNSSVFNKLEF
jgi:hypothetical protein